MSDYIGVVTNIGQAKIAAAIGGTALNLATVRVGDGNGAPITPNPAMTDLVRRVGAAYPIISSGRDPVNANFWRISALIPVNDGPFDIREIGVWDAAGEMIAVARHVLVEKRTPAQGAAVELLTDIVFPVSETAQVTVQIQPTGQVSIFQMLRAGFTVVESATATAPPGAPVLGRTHVVPPAATGAWNGLAGYLAQWNGSVWVAVNVPDGFVVVVGDKAVDAADRYMRKTAAGWVSGAASSTAYGVVRLATTAEAKARTATDSVLTPAALDQATSGLAEKQPIYPEIITAGGVFAFSNPVGQVIINDGAEWMHRGLVRYTTVEFAAGARTFATTASKTCHLVWDAPGTGLATPIANYPRGRFSLIDRTGASPAEADVSYDTTYDRMLCALVVTNAGNAPTVTPLINRAVLFATLNKTTYDIGASWGVLPGLNVTLNWSRTPQGSIKQLSVDATSYSEALVGSGTTATRYSLQSKVYGYALDNSPGYQYISGSLSMELRV